MIQLRCYLVLKIIKLLVSAKSRAFGRSYFFEIYFNFQRETKIIVQFIEQNILFSKNINFLNLPSCNDDSRNFYRKPRLINKTLDIRYKIVIIKLSYHLYKSINNKNNYNYNNNNNNNKHNNNN